MSHKPSPSKTVLLVEDEPDICEAVKRIFMPYGDDLCLRIAGTAQKAMEFLYQNKKSAGMDAIILDIMLPYGDQKIREELQGEGDISSIETGIHLLELIRSREAKEDLSPVWVNVITGRNAPDVLNRLKILLNHRGRLLVKPFNDFVLENDISCVIGLKSKVPIIMLPQDYKSPDPVEKSHGI